MDRRALCRLRNPSAEGMPGLKERILDAEVVEFLPVLQVLGVEDATIGLEGGGYD